jgi:hypothetical protein
LFIHNLLYYWFHMLYPKVWLIGLNILFFTFYSEEVQSLKNSNFWHTLCSGHGKAMGTSLKTFMKLENEFLHTGINMGKNI